MLKLFLLVLLAGLFACSHVDDKTPVSIESTSRQDGPPSDRRDLSLIKDAQPKPVTRTRAGNKSPYTVFGKTYYLLKESTGYKERGGASWYGSKFHGRLTANGEPYDMWAMTAAHKTLPIPSYVKVTNLANGRSVVLRVNDRGPFHSDRIIDLSYAAASKLGFAKKGTAQVEVVDVTPTASSNSNTVSSSAPAPKTKKPVVTPKLEDAPLDTIIFLPPSEPPTSESEASEAQSSETKASKSKVAKPKSSIPFVEKTFQVAAFNDSKKASKLKAKLSKLLTVPVKVVTDKTGTWYRVRVGPIKNAQQLKQTKQRLREQGISSPMPVLK